MTLQNAREMMSLINNLMQQVSLSVGKLIDSTCTCKRHQINFWVKIYHENLTLCNMNLFYCAM